MCRRSEDILDIILKSSLHVDDNRVVCLCVWKSAPEGPMQRVAAPILQTASAAGTFPLPAATPKDSKI
jgi:hypothetical protein